MCMEQDKTNGNMKNGAAMARKPVTSTADFGGSRDTFLVTTLLHMCYFIVLMSSLLLYNVENSKK